jgi:hypothetical protein
VRAFQLQAAGREDIVHEVLLTSVTRPLCAAASHLTQLPVSWVVSVEGSHTAQRHQLIGAAHDRLARFDVLQAMDKGVTETKDEEAATTCRQHVWGVGP